MYYTQLPLGLGVWASGDRPIDVRIGSSCSQALL